jgi:aminopeptidase N
MTETPRAILRSDYRPPAFLVDRVNLDFELDPAATIVRSRLDLRRNPAGEAGAPLRLDGQALELLEVKLDGAVLDASRYEVSDEALTIPRMPDQATLEITTRIAPEKNTELSGLYTSGGNYYTQCEAEGFRRITYFPDRPDVMSRYTVIINADRERCPVMLSNGNPKGSGAAPNGRHWVLWEDPHPKPSYLFALVAGDLIDVHDHFVTRSGKLVALNIWVRRGDEDRCAHAMDSLKRAMRWDEEVFGLEYDLDVFNIAAVSDFNMGAMENKGLNVFNTKYVLATAETATDADYQGIETVVAHEYFHNWTGNRVTCRDWFQLSLKEGLTVFRDQEFSSDMGSRAVKRLKDVRRLRAAQFPEDASPMAHPVRPDSYIEIDNFYTPTVYDKGAEVVRLLHTRIGATNFRKGMDLYFQRHDNQAVTIEDFVSAMQDASGIDLSAFKLWYSQAGTPEVIAEDSYDAAARRYTLTLRQQVKPTPGQPEKQPLPIPVATGLLAPNGQQIAERMLLLEQVEQSFTFENVATKPIPSLLRGFSAPVKLLGVPRDRLRFLAVHDTDPFVRWDSGQQYATAVMLDLIAAQAAGQPMQFDPALAEAVEATLAGAERDPAFAAEALFLPGESYVADQMEVAEPELIHEAREFLRREIAGHCAASLRRTYDALEATDPRSITGEAIGRRALRNACLSYLATQDVALAKRQFDAGRNMTEVLAALDLLAAAETAERDAALAAFHAKWRKEDLVLDKWFSIQAMAPHKHAVAEVRALYTHADFDLKNPNRARSLIGAFAYGNQVRFHENSGEGYRFLADAIIALDPINAATAARLVEPLTRWRRQNAARGALMQQELRRILAQPKLSKGTYEKLAKALA